MVANRFSVCVNCTKLLLSLDMHFIFQINYFNIDLIYFPRVQCLIEVQYIGSQLSNLSILWNFRNFKYPENIHKVFKEIVIFNDSIQIPANTLETL